MSIVMVKGESTWHSLYTDVTIFAFLNYGLDFVFFFAYTVTKMPTISLLMAVEY